MSTLEIHLQYFFSNRYNLFHNSNIGINNIAVAFFSPFYRVEQLIIRATDSKQWMRNNTANPNTLYGPVLRKDILIQVSLSQYC